MDGTPFGRYRLVELLGRGGMGEVWKAFDTAMNRVNYPRTAHALDALEDNWVAQFREFFDGITVDPRHARQVSALLPAALRGLYAERTFGSHLNIDDALEGLREAITLYMTPSPRKN